MKIQALLFDLGKVLVDFDFDAAMETLHASCPVSRERFEEVIWDKSWIRPYERGEITTSDFYAYLRKTVALKMDLPEFYRVWTDVFLPDPIVSEGLLAGLKRNYPLILVSNTNEAHADFIRAEYRIFEYFDRLVLSYQVGSLKPDTKIFEHAIAAAGHPPEALFFTDDRAENIEAASRMGIHAHQFVSEPDLIRALRETGVETGL